MNDEAVTFRRFGAGPSPREAAFFGAIMLARPKGVKGSGIQGFIKSVTLCTTMGKSIRVTTQSILNASLKARKRQ